MAFQTQVPDIWGPYHRGLETIGTGIADYIKKKQLEREAGRARRKAEKYLTTKESYQGTRLLNPPLQMNELNRPIPLPTPGLKTPLSTPQYRELSQALTPKVTGYREDQWGTTTPIEKEPAQRPLSLSELLRIKKPEMTPTIAEKTIEHRPSLPEGMSKEFYDAIMAEKLKQDILPEEYTLAAGSARFRGGKPIAVMPETENLIGKYDPSNYTPASWAKFIKTEDPSILERYEKPEKPKEVNLAPVIDIFLTQKFGAKYTSSTPQERAQYVDYLSTPEGRAEFEREAPKLMTLTATPFYQVVPTAEGLVQFNVRKPGGSPTVTGLGKPLTSEMITAEQQFQTMKDSLNIVKTLYRPEYIGAVQGRLGTAKEYTIGINTEQATFYSALEGIKNALIYALSGKQINESEYNRLLKQLPDRNHPDNVFQARLTEFERVLNSIIKNREKLMGGYGIFKVTKPPTQGTKQKTTTPDRKQELKKKYGLE